MGVFVRQLKVLNLSFRWSWVFLFADTFRSYVRNNFKTFSHFSFSDIFSVTWSTFLLLSIDYLLGQFDRIYIIFLGHFKMIRLMTEKEAGMEMSYFSPDFTDSAYQPLFLKLLCMWAANCDIRGASKFVDPWKHCSGFQVGNHCRSYFPKAVTPWTRHAKVCSPHAQLCTFYDDFLLNRKFSVHYFRARKVQISRKHYYTALKHCEQCALNLEVITVQTLLGCSEHRCQGTCFESNDLGRRPRSGEVSW